MDTDARADAPWLAELHRQRFGRDSMVRLLRTAVPDNSLSPDVLHNVLREIPWRAVLTTNFDTLLERTFEGAHVCVDDVDFVASSERGAIELIHLHGIINRPGTIVLAHEDYRRYAETRPGMLAKVRQLFLQHPVLFVGFGVADPNFMQWAGWLSDVVGEAKNPWVSLVYGAAPSLAHARYWGSKLEFIGIDAEKFKANAERLLHIIGEALETDARKIKDAQIRLGATQSPEEVLKEVGEQLDLGKKTGAEGGEWDYFREQVVNAAASRVLDLGHEPWLEPSGAEREQMIGLIPQIGQQVSEREFSARTRVALERAFGNQWDPWLDMMRKLFKVPFWRFLRRDLTEESRSNIWNEAWVQLRDASITTESPRTPLACLRAGEIPEQADPLSAQDLRFAGYLAMQEGRIMDAIRNYGRGVEASHAEGEHPRTEWLTLRSHWTALETAIWHRTESEEARKQLEVVMRRERELHAQIARLSEDGRLDRFYFQEINAERQLANQLVDDLARLDMDTTVRLGKPYSSATEWLDRLESLFVAPAIIAPAADAQGTNEWRYGELAAGARTLARYGSKRLATLTHGYVNDVNSAPERVTSLVGELLQDGRWPGEWVARAEALLFVIPSLTKEQVERLACFIKLARDAVAQSKHTRRGGSVEAQWSASISVERLAPARWAMLSASEACVASALPGAPHAQSFGQGSPGGGG